MTLIDLRDGELRTLKFGALALSRFELLICNGAGFYGMLESILNSRPPFYVLSGLLWAGLGGETTHEEACSLLDHYIARSGDKYDGQIWLSIMEALREAGVFRDGEKKPVLRPLQDPKSEEKVTEIRPDLRAVPDQPGATDEEYEARIAHLKQERREWKREMGFNL